MKEKFIYEVLQEADFPQIGSPNITAGSGRLEFRRLCDWPQQAMTPINTIGATGKIVCPAFQPALARLAKGARARSTLLEVRLAEALAKTIEANFIEIGRAPCVGTGSGSALIQLRLWQRI